jgi:asparagine synthetase B (glutamine-hydrolysing)
MKKANGETYNHKKIRKQFGAKHTFTTGSDCEVIIPLVSEGIVANIFNSDRQLNSKVGGDRC